jgi:prophage regulatory protein
MAILRIQSVKSETGHCSHASIYSLIHAGLFTMPVRIGQRAVGWPSDEVAAINQARVAGMSDTDIRALVTQLHQARCSGEPFKPTWLDRCAQARQQATKRAKRTAVNADNCQHTVSIGKEPMPIKQQVAMSEEGRTPEGTKCASLGGDA